MHLRETKVARRTAHLSTFFVAPCMQLSVAATPVSADDFTTQLTKPGADTELIPMLQPAAQERDDGHPRWLRAYGGAMIGAAVAAPIMAAGAGLGALAQCRNAAEPSSYGWGALNGLGCALGPYMGAGLAAVTLMPLSVGLGTALIDDGHGNHGDAGMAILGAYLGTGMAAGTTALSVLLGSSPEVLLAIAGAALLIGPTTMATLFYDISAKSAEANKKKAQTHPRASLRWLPYARSTETMSGAEVGISGQF